MTTTRKNKSLPDTTSSPLEQMLDKAHKQLADIEATEQQVHAQQSEHQAEASRVQEHATQREGYLATRRTMRDQQLQSVEQAKNFATLAQGTGNETKSVKELKELQQALAETEQDVARLEDQASKERKEEQDRLAAIQDDIMACQKKLQECARRRGEILSAQERARREHIEALTRDMTLKLDLQQAEIDARKRAVTEAQVVQEGLLDEARLLVKEYPEAYTALVDWFPFEDTTTRVLQLELDYISLLLDERLTIPRYLPVSAVNGFYYGLHQLLVIPPDELYADQTLQGNPAMLMRRKQLVEQAIVEWRAKNKGKRV